MDYYQIDISIEEKFIDQAVDALVIGGFDCFQILDGKESIQQFLDQSKASWDYSDADELFGGEVGIRVFLPDEEDVEECINGLKNALEPMRSIEGFCYEINHSNVKQEDWANRWKQHYAPIPIGEKLVVKPSWQELPEEFSNRAVIEIESGLAFGTGDHETTKLCLELMQRCDFSQKHVLDVGTGTGILAIAAMRLGARDVLAVDIDPMSMSAGATNIELNDLTSSITLRQADLLKGVDAGKFSMITINIVADVVMEFLGVANRYLDAGGAIVCSGIIDFRQDDVLLAASEHGFSCIDNLSMGDWRAFVCVRSSLV